jgi:photosystem II stability/assembly factor-like uncharacterized protein
MKPNWFFKWLSVSLFVCASALAHTGKLVSMKLLTPQVGWASAEYRLFWTTDGGRRWSDITPTAENKRIASVSFVDVSTGWVLFSDYDQAKSAPVFDIASTTNAGASWTVSTLKPAVPPGYDLAQDGQIEFVDSAHGWIGLGTQGNSPACVLLGTEDGGQTWKRTSLECDSGSVHFATTRDGWNTSKDSDRIYVTHDGGKTWREFSQRAPVQAGSATSPFYELPEFTDSDHGFLAVTFAGGEKIKSVLVLFATSDGGRTWKTFRFMPLQEALEGGATSPSTAVDSAWIHIAVDHLTLTLNAVSLTSGATESKRAHVTSVVKPTPGQRFTHGQNAVHLSFVSRTQGWAMVSTNPCAPGLNGCFLLISTSNGGATWTNITPPETKGKELTPIRGTGAALPSTSLAAHPRPIPTSAYIWGSIKATWNRHQTCSHGGRTAPTTIRMSTFLGQPIGGLIPT